MTETLALHVELSHSANNSVASRHDCQTIQPLPTNTNPYPQLPTPTPHPTLACPVDSVGSVQLIGSIYPYVPLCTPLILESLYHYTKAFWILHQKNGALRHCRVRGKPAQNKRHGGDSPIRCIIKSTQQQQRHEDIYLRSRHHSGCCQCGTIRLGISTTHQNQ